MLEYFYLYYENFYNKCRNVVDIDDNLVEKWIFLFGNVDDNEIENEIFMIFIMEFF